MERELPVVVGLVDKCWVVGGEMSQGLLDDSRAAGGNGEWVVGLEEVVEGVLALAVCHEWVGAEGE